MNSTAAVTKPKSPFETTSCGRCSGTGYTGFTWVHGGVCFRCGGVGSPLTTRGRMAQDYFNALLSKPVGDVKVGDVIRFESVTMGGGTLKTFATVTAIGVVPSRSRVMVGNEWVPCPDQVRIDGTKTYTGGETREFRGYVALDGMVRMAADVEQKQAAVAKALEFQATLTKTGKPRKR